MTKIMVVDDEEDMTHVISAILKREGYEVAVANSGEECLKKLDEEKPDLILLDVMMPGIDGWETCSKIREREDTKNIPVVMLTVKTSEEDMSKSFEHKSDAHVGKPIIKEKLLETIKWVLRAKGG
jgi:CheY-like chemotaxis protein